MTEKATFTPDSKNPQKRHQSVLTILLTALLAMGTLLVAPAATAEPATALKPPTCTNFYVVDESYSARHNTYYFKVVGVDLKEWIPAGDSGSVTIGWSDDSGGDSTTINAAGQSGVRSGLLDAYISSGNQQVLIDVRLVSDSGRTLCTQFLTANG